MILKFSKDFQRKNWCGKISMGDDVLLLGRVVIGTSIIELVCSSITGSRTENRVLII